MNIYIDVSAYYEWMPIDREPTPEEVQFNQVKRNHEGKWVKKALCTRDTHTHISLPETEIQDCSAHFERVGSPKTRGQVAAWYLAEKTMPHHAHPEHFKKIVVEGEPEVEKYLNLYFEVKN